MLSKLEIKTSMNIFSFLFVFTLEAFVHSFSETTTDLRTNLEVQIERQVESHFKKDAKNFRIVAIGLTLLMVTTYYHPSENPIWIRISLKYNAGKRCYLLHVFQQSQV